MEPNTFSYQLASNRHDSGAFNIYQARNGGIYLVMQNYHTLLLQRQVEELHLPISELSDFLLSDYQAFYKIDLNNEECEDDTQFSEHKNMTLLHSVGCAIDNKLMLYPLFSNGLPDKSNPSSLDDCSEEFFETLSLADRVKIEELKKSIKP